MINFIGISKTYDNGKSFVVNNIDLEIKSNETLVILGSSGSGKTTLLKMINRLVTPSSGEITLDKKNITDQDPVLLRRGMGYVFQGVGLFPHMTVAENISIVLRLNKKSLADRMQRAHELLTLVNLDPPIYANRFPDELSGGQRQRVGVARALASDPEFLLMDEPFGALDMVTRFALQSEMLLLKKRLQKTIIFVTHDVFEALRLGDRIAVMNQGRIEQIGDKNTLLHQPATKYVRELFQYYIQQCDLIRD